MLPLLIDPARPGTQDVFVSESRAARTRDSIVVDASTWQEIVLAWRKFGFEVP